MMDGSMWSGGMSGSLGLWTPVLVLIVVGLVAWVVIGRRK
ncbi:hypothetical protein BH11PSE8_BH11PSE8_31260 [soil metagenome]